MHLYFISPHLDDAIFSAGNLITKLCKRHKVTILTVFTQASEAPDTLFSRMFTHRSGFDNAKDFFQARKEEDMQVCHSLGADIIHLPYIDVAWRKKRNRDGFLLRLFPELIHLYPTRFHILSGIIHKNDNYMIRKITKELKSRIEDSSTVFCPLGIGNNVDHIIIRTICKNNFAHVIYWQDYPYMLRNKDNIPFIEENSLKRARFTELFDKRNLIEGYRSQTKAYFTYQKIINNTEEYYSVDEKLLKNCLLLK